MGYTPYKYGMKAWEIINNNHQIHINFSVMERGYRMKWKLHENRSPWKLEFPGAREEDTVWQRAMTA